MNSRNASRASILRIWANITTVLILISAVWALGTYFPLGRSGLRPASASSTPAAVDRNEAREKTIKKQYALALAEYYAGEYGRAKELFAGIATYVPGYLSDDILFWRAECAFRIGDLKSAETGFRMFLGQGSRGPRAEIALNRLSLLKKRSN